MVRIIAIFVVVVALFSCQPEGRVYVEHQELSPELQWLQEDVREFKVPIADDSIAYDMSLSFRYINGFPYKLMKVKVTETSPSGVELVKEYDLTVREENGDYIGEAGGDIWDSEHLIEPNKKYEIGTYTYVIEHNMENNPVVSVMEIGVVLDKTK